MLSCSRPRHLHMVQPPHTLPTASVPPQPMCTLQVRAPQSSEFIRARNEANLHAHIASGIAAAAVAIRGPTTGHAEYATRKPLAKCSPAQTSASTVQNRCEYTKILKVNTLNEVLTPKLICHHTYPKTDGLRYSLAFNHKSYPYQITQKSMSASRA